MPRLFVFLCVCVFLILKTASSSAFPPCSDTTELSRTTVHCPKFNRQWAEDVIKGDSYRDKYLLVKKMGHNRYVMDEMFRDPSALVMIKYLPPSTKWQYQMDYADLFGDEVQHDVQKALFQFYNQADVNITEKQRYDKIDAFVDKTTFHNDILKPHLAHEGYGYDVQLKKGGDIPYTGLNQIEGRAVYWAVEQDFFIRLYDQKGETIAYYLLETLSHLQRQLVIDPDDVPHKLMLKKENYSKINAPNADEIGDFQIVQKIDWDSLNQNIPILDKDDPKCQKPFVFLISHKDTYGCPQINMAWAREKPTHPVAEAKYGHIRDMVMRRLAIRSGRLLPGAIYENVRLDKPDLTDEEAKKKAKALMLSLYTFSSRPFEMSDEMKTYNANQRMRVNQTNSMENILSDMDVTKYYNDTNDCKKSVVKFPNPNKYIYGYVIPYYKEHADPSQISVKAIALGDIEMQPIEAFEDENRQGVSGREKTQYAGRYYWNFMLPIEVSIYEGEEKVEAQKIKVFARFSRDNYLHNMPSSCPRYKHFISRHHEELM